MTLVEIAAIADLVAALGVIGTLLFLAWEIRRGAEQTRLANWQAVIAGLREHKRRTDDPSVARIVVRGRADYDGLEPWEKVTFGNYMEEMIQGFDGLLLHGRANVVSREETRRAAIGAFRFHFGFPGSRAWWRESGLAKRWPRHLVGAVEEGIAAAESEA